MFHYQPEHIPDTAQTTLYFLDCGACGSVQNSTKHNKAMKY